LTDLKTAGVTSNSSVAGLPPGTDHLDVPAAYGLGEDEVGDGVAVAGGLAVLSRPLATAEEQHARLRSPAETASREQVAAAAVRRSG
jgi:hypothetical protein